MSSRLLEHGGIYLDIDAFILQPFADHSLLRYDTVMGMEAHDLSFPRSFRPDDEMAPKGLCNAVIIAKKGAEFLQRWLESYEEFREDQWTEHSVVGLVDEVTKHKLMSDSGDAVDPRKDVSHTGDSIVGTSVLLADMVAGPYPCGVRDDRVRL